MNSDQNFEERLSALREQAKHGAPLRGHGVDVVGGPIPRQAGYYGQSVVRPPVWTWEIPLYFFVGGAAGMAPLVACCALLLRQIDLACAALWIAAVGAIISPVLLVADLGRPRLFINMLRVFKYQSPMSVGAWTLTFFGGFALPAWLLMLLYQTGAFPPSSEIILILVGVFSAGAAAFGLVLATYTGVLIGATAIPAWHVHRMLLPIHFGTAGLGCAGAILEWWQPASKCCCGFGSNSINMARRTVRCTKAAPAGWSGRANSFPARSRSCFAQRVWCSSRRRLFC
jgi:hypothetical protein